MGKFREGPTTKVMKLPLHRVECLLDPYHGQLSGHIDHSLRLCWLQHSSALSVPGPWDTTTGVTMLVRLLSRGFAKCSPQDPLYSVLSHSASCAMKAMALDWAGLGLVSLLLYPTPVCMGHSLSFLFLNLLQAPALAWRLVYVLLYLTTPPLLEAWEQPSGMTESLSELNRQSSHSLPPQGSTILAWCIVGTGQTVVELTN